MRITQGFSLDKVQNVHCNRLDAIFDKYCMECPDFVSLDIEGLESEVLSNFDFSRWPVKVWCIEKNPGLVPEIMKHNGYVLTAETPPNWIYSLKDLDQKYIRNWFEHWE